VPDEDVSARALSTERARWDAVAAGWRHWWPTFERAAQVVSDHLVEAADVRDGDRVLDVATGIGEPAVTAARRVGPAGRVVATDLSPRMLAIARERATALGLPNILFHETDGESLAVGESEFAAALCRWGLMLFGDCERTAERVHQLLAPGGRFAAAVWSTPERVPFISLGTTTAARVLGLTAAPDGGPGPFRLADRRRLQQVFASVDFRDIRVEAVPVVFAWTSAEAYVAFLHDASGALAALRESHPPERLRALGDALLDAGRQYAAADGTVTMENEALCIVGRK
jgi:SAM-dependent methyltransferase